MQLRSQTVKQFFRYYSLSFILFLIFFLITVLLYHNTRKNTTAYNKEIFDNRSALATASIERRMNYYILILNSVRALFLSSDTVSKNEWQRFIDALNIEQEFPGVQGVGYSVVVPPGQLAPFTKRMRSRDMPGFEVKPPTSRSVYTSVIYLDPPNQNNLKVIGFDLLTDSVARKAMERATDFDMPVISEKVTLRNKSGQGSQPGFLIFLPLYRDKNSPPNLQERRRLIKGFVYSTFMASDLLGKILKDQYQQLDIEVYDGDITPGSLLFDKDPETNYFTKRGKYNRVIQLKIAGCVWNICFFSLPSFEPPSERKFSILILLGGSIISILVFFIVWVLSKIRVNSERSTAIVSNKNRELIRINNDLDSFVYAASHDLKAPISNLEGLLTIVKQEIRPDCTTEVANVLLLMEQSIMKLRNIIFELTNISRIQRGLEQDVEDVRIDELIEEFKITHSTLIEASGAVIKTEISSPALHFSKKNLRSILFNLLTNAIKYSAPDRKPEILVKTWGGNKYTALSVKDNGLGIRADQLEKVFGMFKRAHSHVSGTGIGLYIVKKIIENAGGKIEVESEEGKGSTFIIYFPDMKK